MAPPVRKSEKSPDIIQDNQAACLNGKKKESSCGKVLWIDQKSIYKAAQNLKIQIEKKAPEEIDQFLKKTGVYQIRDSIEAHILIDKEKEKALLKIDSLFQVFGIDDIQKTEVGYQIRIDYIKNIEDWAIEEKNKIKLNPNNKFTEAPSIKLFRKAMQEDYYYDRHAQFLKSGQKERHLSPQKFSKVTFQDFEDNRFRNAKKAVKTNDIELSSALRSFAHFKHYLYLLENNELKPKNKRDELINETILAGDDPIDPDQDPVFDKFQVHFKREENLEPYYYSTDPGAILEEDYNPYAKHRDPYFKENHDLNEITLEDYLQSYENYASVAMRDSELKKAIQSFPKFKAYLSRFKRERQSAEKTHESGPQSLSVVCLDEESCYDENTKEKEKAGNLSPSFQARKPFCLTPDQATQNNRFHYPEGPIRDQKKWSTLYYDVYCEEVDTNCQSLEEPDCSYFEDNYTAYKYNAFPKSSVYPFNPLAHQFDPSPNDNNFTYQDFILIQEALRKKAKDDSSLAEVFQDQNYQFKRFKTYLKKHTYGINLEEKKYSINPNDSHFNDFLANLDPSLKTNSDEQEFTIYDYMDVYPTLLKKAHESKNPDFIAALRLSDIKKETLKMMKSESLKYKIKFSEREYIFEALLSFQNFKDYISQADGKAPQASLHWANKLMSKLPDSPEFEQAHHFLHQIKVLSEQSRLPKTHQSAFRYALRGNNRALKLDPQLIPSDFQEISFDEFIQIRFKLAQEVEKNNDFELAQALRSFQDFEDYLHRASEDDKKPDQKPVYPGLKRNFLRRELFVEYKKICENYEALKLSKSSPYYKKLLSLSKTEDSWDFSEDKPYITFSDYLRLYIRDKRFRKRQTTEFDSFPAFKLWILSSQHRPIEKQNPNYRHYDFTTVEANLWWGAYMRNGNTNRHLRTDSILELDYLGIKAPMAQAYKLRYLMATADLDPDFPHKKANARALVRDKKTGEIKILSLSDTLFISGFDTGHTPGKDLRIYWRHPHFDLIELYSSCGNILTPGKDGNKLRIKSNQHNPNQLRELPPELSEEGLVEAFSFKKERNPQDSKQRLAVNPGFKKIIEERVRNIDSPEDVMLFPKSLYRFLSDDDRVQFISLLVKANDDFWETNPDQDKKLSGKKKLFELIEDLIKEKEREKAKYETQTEESRDAMVMMEIKSRRRIQYIFQKLIDKKADKAVFDFMDGPDRIKFLVLLRKAGLRIQVDQMYNIHAINELTRDDGLKDLAPFEADLFSRSNERLAKEREEFFRILEEDLPTLALDRSLVENIQRELHSEIEKWSRRMELQLLAGGLFYYPPFVIYLKFINKCVEKQKSFNTELEFEEIVNEVVAELSLDETKKQDIYNRLMAFQAFQENPDYQELSPPYPPEIQSYVSDYRSESFDFNRKLKAAGHPYFQISLNRDEKPTLEDIYSGELPSPLCDYTIFKILFIEATPTNRERFRNTHLKVQPTPYFSWENPKAFVSERQEDYQRVLDNFFAYFEGNDKKEAYKKVNAQFKDYIKKIEGHLSHQSNLLLSDETFPEYQHYKTQIRIIEEDLLFCDSKNTGIDDKKVKTREDVMKLRLDDIESSSLEQKLKYLAILTRGRFPFLIDDPKQRFTNDHRRQVFKILNAVADNYNPHEQGQQLVTWLHKLGLLDQLHNIMSDPWREDFVETLAQLGVDATNPLFTKFDAISQVADGVQLSFSFLLYPFTNPIELLDMLTQAGHLAAAAALDGEINSDTGSPARDAFPKLVRQILNDFNEKIETAIETGYWPTYFKEMMAFFTSEAMLLTWDLFDFRHMTQMIRNGWATPGVAAAAGMTTGALLTSLGYNAFNQRSSNTLWAMYANDFGNSVEDAYEDFHPRSLAEQKGKLYFGLDSRPFNNIRQKLTFKRSKNYKEYTDCTKDPEISRRYHDFNDNLRNKLTRAFNNNQSCRYYEAMGTQIFKKKFTGKYFKKIVEDLAQIYFEASDTRVGCNKKTNQPNHYEVNWLKHHGFIKEKLRQYLGQHEIREIINRLNSVNGEEFYYQEIGDEKRVYEKTPFEKIGLSYPLNDTKLDQLLFFLANSQDPNSFDKEEFCKKEINQNLKH